MRPDRCARVKRADAAAARLPHSMRRTSFPLRLASSQKSIDPMLRMGAAQDALLTAVRQRADSRAKSDFVVLLHGQPAPPGPCTACRLCWLAAGCFSTSCSMRIFGSVDGGSFSDTGVALSSSRAIQILMR